MSPLVDCHTHSFFSDGISSFEENVEAAAACGCTTLVSSDHLTLPASMDPACEVQVRLDELTSHKQAFEKAKEYAHTCAPSLDMIYGFECDWYQGCESNIKVFAKDAQLLLGSVHWLGDPGDISIAAGSDKASAVAYAGDKGSSAGWIDDVNDLHIWKELGADELWRRYVSTWCLACDSPLCFDIMAHPDLPARFARDGFAPLNDLSPLWDEMAQCAKDTGRRIELSTAGLRKSLHDYYPSRPLLERFAKADVPLTLGSDAHAAKDICFGIQDAKKYALSCGYTSFDVPFSDGSWRSFPLF